MKKFKSIFRVFADPVVGFFCFGMFVSVVAGGFQYYMDRPLSDDFLAELSISQDPEKVCAASELNVELKKRKEAGYEARPIDRWAYRQIEKKCDGYAPDALARQAEILAGGA